MEKKWGTVNKSELALSLSEKFSGLRIEDVKFAVDNILKQMSAALCVGRRIEVRGFGIFTLRNYPPSVARNPKTGKEVLMPTRYLPRFRAGKELRERVNNKGK